MCGGGGGGGASLFIPRVACEVPPSTQKNKSLVDRSKDINQRAMVEIKKRPIVFALSLATLTQGIRSLINRDDKDKDLPPLFPPI